MRETVPVTWSDEKLILLYCPGRGSNLRPSAHRGFKHGQGVLVQQPSMHFYLNLAKIPPNQVFADFVRGSSVESESE